MNQQIFLGLTMIASMSALTIPAFPALVQAQTRIDNLQPPRGTTISGKVVSVVGNDFILNDGTGQIIVDAGPRWWREINLSPGEQVTVTGELDKKGEFDAFSINRSGSVIEIRPADGPPPWAGGTNRDRPTPRR